MNQFLEFNTKFSYLIKPRHQFFTYKNKSIAIIYYIINYGTKINFNQCQDIMSIAIVQKIYINIQLKTTITGFLLSIRHINLDKFAWQTFYKPVYKHEVNRFLAVLCFLGFFNYYSDNILLQHIILNLLCCCFVGIIFHKSNIFQLSNNNVIFTSFVLLLLYIFEHYQYKKIHLFEFCFYVYFLTISIVKHQRFSKQILKFEKLYSYKLNLI